MPGFVAWFDWERRDLDKARVQIALTAAAFRGPSGGRIVALPHCVLGFVASDASNHGGADDYPLVQADIGLIGVSRLDNRLQLATDLGVPATTDASTLVAAYHRYGGGADLANALRGDFSLIFWDARKRSVVAVRDALGIRPLFYRSWPQQLAFSTDVESLIGLAPDVTAQLHSGVILDHLQGRFRHDRETFFREIVRLRPGHLLAADHGGVKETRWFMPPVDEIRLHARDAYLEQFRLLLRQAVQTRIPATPCIVEVSGGLDSSAVACVTDDFVRRAPQANVRGVGVIFPGLACDEQPYIDAVGRRVKFPVDSVDGRDTDLLGFETRAYPTRPDVPNVVAAIARTATAHGARITLAGDGGDELFFEAVILRDLFDQRRWPDLAREIAITPDYTTRSRLQGLLDLGRFEAARFRQYVAPFRRPPAPPSWLGPALRDAWIARHEIAPTPPHHGFATESAAWTWHALTSAHGIWSSELAESWSAHAGLERRYPLLDVGIVSFVLQLPLEQRLADGRSKRFLRDAVPNMPDVVRSRFRAVDFASCVQHNIQRQEQALRALFFGPVWRAEPYISQKAAQKMFESARPGVSPLAEVQMMWNVFCLEQWLRLLERN